MAFDYAYGKTILNDLELHGVHKEDSGAFQLTGVTIEGQLVIPSRGFVKSLCERFAISRRIQSKRTSGELLSLIFRSFPFAEVEYRIAWDHTGTTWLFACEAEQPADVLEKPVPEDIPSPTSRLEAYGFAKPSKVEPAAADEPASSNQPMVDSPNAYDWPLFRDLDCQVPAASNGDQSQPPMPLPNLFSHGPAGTLRPSIN